MRRELHGVNAISIAPAVEMDMPEWLAMRQSLWPDEDALELAAELPKILGISGEKRAWIARCAQGRAIGFIEAGIRSYAEGCEGPTPYLEGIWVEESWRERGVGRALVACVAQWAGERGYGEFASDALLANEASHAWHRRVGFEEVERIVIFRKEL